MIRRLFRGPSCRVGFADDQAGTCLGGEAAARRARCGSRRRTRPLEVEVVALGEDGEVTVPTLAEILRVKAYLVVQRNQVRDYLDVVALAERTGPGEAVGVLASIDGYYVDRSGGPDSVLTALIQRLAEPSPRDRAVTGQLSAYKGLDSRWHEWKAVTEACGELAVALLDTVAGGREQR